MEMKLVTIQQAAPKLGFSRAGLYRLIREGQFPVPSAVLRFGSQYRINLAAVEAATKADQPVNQQVASAAQK
jgi:excisionase family DNA binding protein